MVKVSVDPKFITLSHIKKVCALKWAVDYTIDNCQQSIVVDCCQYNIFDVSILPSVTFDPRRLFCCHHYMSLNSYISWDSGSDAAGC